MTTDAPNHPNSKHGLLRSFGRRKGRPLSPRQQSLLDAQLPALTLDLQEPPPQPLTALFEAPVTEVAIEIGFGGAEHLIGKAKANPHIGYIGCEPFEEGLAKAVTGIAEQTLTNVRLFGNDARDVLAWLPDEALRQVYILFPDPWPKARHAKRRLISPAFLELLHPKLQPDASVRVATDIGAYLETALRAFRTVDRFVWSAESSRDWRERPADWIVTRYEKKALAAGRPCYVLDFRRT